MKGPSLHYDLRVLRIFRCDGCGRQVQTPGSVTSHTCHCSDPPKFMRPLDRPKTVSPDVSAFLSPQDPADLVEEEIIEETPHVPYVPPKPPTPARFANRRKLYEETAPGPDLDPGNDNASSDEVSFGEGIDQGLNAEAASEQETLLLPESSESLPADRETRSARANRKFNEKPQQRRRGRGGRTSGDRQTDTSRERPGRIQESKDVQPLSAASPPPDTAAADKPDSESESEGDESAGSTSAVDGSGSPRRRSRRRGRRRGPRPEGGGT